MMTGTYADPTDATLALYALLLLLLTVALLWIRRMGGKSHEQLEMEQEEHLLDKIEEKLSTSKADDEAFERCVQQARLYSAIKNSKRIELTRVWVCDRTHVEVVVGEALAWCVGADGVAWVTIKKDDGHVLTIPHSVPAELHRKYGMVPVEVKFF